MFFRWMDPLTYGHYPRTVRDLVGDRLLKFTDEESQLLRGSYDFLGLQYYTSYYAKPNAIAEPNHIRYKTDSGVTETRKLMLKNNPFIYLYQLVHLYIC